MAGGIAKKTAQYRSRHETAQQKRAREGLLRCSGHRLPKPQSAARDDLSMIPVEAAYAHVCIHGCTAPRINHHDVLYFINSSLSHTHLRRSTHHPPPIPRSFILCEILVSEAGLDFPSLCMIPKVSITWVGPRSNE
jgi:hypothetical protein